MFNSGVSDVRGIVDTLFFCSHGIKKLYGISHSNRAIALGIICESMIEERNGTVLIIVIVLRLIAKPNLYGFSVIIQRYIISLRDHNISDTIRDVETRKRCRIAAVSHGIGQRVARLSRILVYSLLNRDRFVGLVNFDLRLAAGNVLAAVHFPCGLIGLGGLIRLHGLQLSFSHCCVIGHLIIALCYSCGAESGNHIKGKVLTVLRHRHGLAIDLHTGSIQCLKASKLIVKDHGIKCSVHIDIGSVVQSITAVLILRRVDALGAFLNRILVINRYSVTGSRETEGIFPIITDTCFIRHHSDIKVPCQAGFTIKESSVRKCQGNFVILDNVGSEFSGSN